MTFAADTADLLLSVTPPRVPSNLLTRSRLSPGSEELRDRRVIVMEAPAGFGKTSLLAQWRREFQAEGMVVAWLSARELDEPQRLVRGLIWAYRLSSGRQNFGQSLLNDVDVTGQEGITGWLAQVAQVALNSVLIIDQVNCLPPESQHAINYMLRNLPPNLRVVIASRADCNLAIDDLIAYGQCLKIGVRSLQFRMDETIQLIGTDIGYDAAAKLHELAEGWPLGLQLALSAMACGGDPQWEVTALSARGGVAHDRLLSLLFVNLDPGDVDFLTRIAIADDLHPDLCKTLAVSADEVGRLACIGSKTPIFIAGQNTEWFRMHMLAREELRRRFAKLPAEEQKELHARAAHWCARNGMTDAAAGHAFAAGLTDLACELAEKSLYESLRQSGHQTAVQNWLPLLSREELDKRPRLVLALAWSLALSARHDEADSHVSRLLARANIDEALRCECAMILSGGAIFADDPDKFAELHEPWAEVTAFRDPMLSHIHANRSAFRALLDGDAPLARLHLNKVPEYDLGPARRYLSAWSNFISGLSYLREGQVIRAEQVLSPLLSRVESELGRRNFFATMLAALLAAALWEREQSCEAASLLANRLDVLERSGVPEAVLLAYRTMGRISWSIGAEDRALEHLGALHAVGVARRLPRLCIASLAEQVRLNSHHFRAETCLGLCRRIDELLEDPKLPQGRLWRRSVTLLADTARGFAGVAAQNWVGALQSLAKAETAAQSLRLGRLRIELMGLRAYVLSRLGEDSLSLAREACGLAQSHGLQRVFFDAHPAIGKWMLQLQEGGEPAVAGASVRGLEHRQGSAQTDDAPRAVPSLALTPKEREVLQLLARNLSNKEIGLACRLARKRSSGT